MWLIHWVSGLRGLRGCRHVWLCLAVFVYRLASFPVHIIIPHHVVACYSARLSHLTESKPCPPFWAWGQHADKIDIHMPAQFNGGTICYSFPASKDVEKQVREFITTKTLSEGLEDKLKVGSFIR